MKVYRVEIAPAALAQIERVLLWWAENRPKAPDLLSDELDATRLGLEEAPGMGAVVSHPSGVVRRVPLTRSRFHVYYAIDEAAAVVRILAVWHSSRGQGPPL